MAGSNGADSAQQRLRELAAESCYWHVTTFAGLRGVLRTGAILPNSGERRFRHGLSSVSACQKIGGVSLFDGKLDPKLSMLRVWLTAHKPFTFAFKLDAAALRPNVVEVASRRDRVPGITVKGEVCHRGPIEWRYVKGCLVVRAAYPEQRVFLDRNELDDPTIANALRFLWSQAALDRRANDA